MPNSNKVMIHKLMTAINRAGGRILMDRVQFYSEEQDRPITVYKINELLGKKKCLFDTTSQLQVVMFMRDYWFVIQGKELPTGQAEWNKIRKLKNFDWSGAQYLHDKLEKEKSHGR